MTNVEAAAFLRQYYLVPLQRLGLDDTGVEVLERAIVALEHQPEPIPAGHMAQLANYAVATLGPEARITIQSAAPAQFGRPGDAMAWVGELVAKKQFFQVCGHCGAEAINLRETECGFCGMSYTRH